MKTNFASPLLLTFAVCSIGCATEGRVVTAHGHGVGKLLGDRQAELEARVMAGFLTGEVPFELELTDGGGRSIRMRPPAVAGDDVEITQVSEQAYRARLDVVVPAAVDARRRALGEAPSAEVEVPRGPRAYTRARNAALTELITRANTCPEDVQLLVGVVDVERMDVVESDPARFRVAAHVQLEPCGTSSKMTQEAPPNVRKALEKAGR